MGENKDRITQAFCVRTDYSERTGHKKHARMPGKKVDSIHSFGSREIKAVHHVDFLSNLFLFFNCVPLKVTQSWREL